MARPRWLGPGAPSSPNRTASRLGKAKRRKRLCWGSSQDYTRPGTSSQTAGPFPRSQRDYVRVSRANAAIRNRHHFDDNRGSARQIASVRQAVRNSLPGRILGRQLHCPSALWPVFCPHLIRRSLGDLYLRRERSLHDVNRLHAGFRFCHCFCYFSVSFASRRRPLNAWGVCSISPC
jgi:hypothetical protein